MSWADERAAFEIYLAEEFNDVPIQFDGVPVDDSQDVSEGWVRLSILPGIEGKRITLGNNEQLFRHHGLLVLSIFTSDNIGSNRARTLADTISDLFHERILSYNDSGFIRCGVPGLDIVGSVEGGLYQVNVTVSYQRDVMRS